MTDNLPQEEIDKLLNQANKSSETSQPEYKYLSAEEVDSIGEIGNISLGSAATTLSMLLGNKVEITTPVIKEFEKINEVFKKSPNCLSVEIKYIKGLDDTTIFLLNAEDSSIIANLMMGGDGKPEKTEITELQTSAVGEAMNQMIGTSSTTLASLFNTPIDISPPVIQIHKEESDVDFSEEINKIPVIAVCFKLKVGELIDSEFIQIMSIDSVKKQVANLKSSMDTIVNEVKAPAPTPVTASAPEPAPPAQESVTVQPVQFASFDTSQSISGEQNKNLNLVMDVKLGLSVELGRTELPIKKVLELTRGSVIELDKIAGEPVDLYANGKMIAKGEVVVIEDNFGLRITSIISPQNRITNL